MRLFARPHPPRPRVPRTRARGWALLGALLALGTGAVVTTGSAGAASTGITITATIPSSIALTNNCTAPSSYGLGSVLPGSTALTDTGANVCSLGFTSTNDSAMIRITQADGTGAAMGQKGNWVSFSDADDPLQAINAYDANNVYAVGKGGIVRRSTNGGGAWTEWTNISVGADFRAVDSMPGSSGTWFIGGYDSSGNNVLFRTQNGLAGSPTWQNLTTQLTAAGFPVGGAIQGIEVIDANTAFVVGYGGEVAKTTNASAATPTWTAYTLAGGSIINNIAAVDSNTLYIGADDGVWKTTTGGPNAASWTNTSLGAEMNVAVGDATHVYAVGEFGAIFTSSGGAWTDRSSATTWVDDLRSVTTSSSTPTTAWAVGEYGAILKTTDSGVTWTRQDSGTSNALQSVTAPTSTTLFVAGSNRISLISTDAGTTWTKQYQTAGYATLNGVAAVPTNGQVAVAVGGSAEAGTNALVRRTTDGGTSWATIDPGVSAALFDVALGTSTTGWAVGEAGTILKTTDAGLTWTPQASGTTQRLWSVAAADDGFTAYAVGSNGTVLRTVNGGSTWTALTSGTTVQLRGISIVGTQKLFIVGGAGTVITSSDGGGTLSLVGAGNKPDATSQLFDVTAASATTAYAVKGYGVTWRTTDGGANWSAVNMGVGFWSARSIAATGDNNVLVTGDWGQVSRSTDGGTTWAVEGSAGLQGHAVFAVDPNNGYVVGEGRLARRLHTRTSPANRVVSDYGAGANWGSGGATNAFGICLQGVSAQTIADWTKDTFNTAGKCEAVDSDPWNAVPTTPTKVAHVVNPGDAGRIDVVWGLRPRDDQAPGRYTATVVFEALAPNV